MNFKSGGKAYYLCIFNLKRYDDAIEVFRNVIKINPNFFEAWLNMANAYSEKGDYSNAMESANKCLIINEKSLRGLNAKSYILIKMNRYDDALRVINSALSIDSSYAPVMYNMACVYALVDDKKKALEWLSRAIKLDDNFKKQAQTENDFEKFFTDEDFILIVS